MKTLEEFDVALLEKLVEQRDLIVYNDDFNTFDFVINTLMDVCKHTAEQAVQCTYLIHYKGKCNVKIGTYNELKPMCESLQEKGLTAKIN